MTGAGWGGVRRRSSGVTEGFCIVRPCMQGSATDQTHTKRVHVTAPGVRLSTGRVGTARTGPSSPLPRPVPPPYFMGTLLNVLLRPMLCGCYNPNCHNKALLASQCKPSGTELQANVYGRRRDHIIIIQVCAIGVGKGGTKT